MPDDMMMDVEPAPPPTDAELSRVAALAERQQVEEAEAERLTGLLQRALAALRQTREVDLPEALRAVGMSEFSLLDGTRVKLEDKLIGTKLVSTEGLRWVEDHGGASMIKTTITVEMDRGDLVEARGLLAELKRHRLANSFKKLDLSEYVHQATSAAFARELLEQGEDPPLDTLGVYRVVQTIVGERPKTVELKGIARR
jgi:hypothetical protein